MGNNMENNMSIEDLSTLRFYGKKVYDFSDMKTTGMGRITPMPQIAWKFQEVKLPQFIDPNTNIVYGVPSHIDDKGVLVFKKVVVNGIKNYNLKNKLEAMEFHFLKIHPITLGSPFSHIGPSTKTLTVIDLDAEAKIDNEKADDLLEALTLFKSKLTLDEQVAFASVYGLSPVHMSKERLVKEVSDRLIKNPKKFLELHKMFAEDGVFPTFKKACIYDIIVQKHGIGYLYKNRNLGAMESNAISFLKKNEELFIQVLQDVEEKEEQQRLADIPSELQGKYDFLSKNNEVSQSILDGLNNPVSEFNEDGQPKIPTQSDWEAELLSSGKSGLIEE